VDGPAVKTDGAAVASGAITEALIYGDAAARGVIYDKGWMVGVTTTVKIFIDISSAFGRSFSPILTRHIERAAGRDRLQAVEIWARFRNSSWLHCHLPYRFLHCACLKCLFEALSAAMNEANVFRQIFFLLTFFAIGLMADLRKLWQEGIGRLAAVYVVCLFGFVLWVGLIISWVFFHGVQPPIASR
jgi:hypothetical protein